jgi:hypothetical protein
MFRDSRASVGGENGGMGDRDAPLNCERLAELLDREGQLRDSYGIGRRGKHATRPSSSIRGSKHWVVYYTELVLRRSAAVGL